MPAPTLVDLKKHLNIPGSADDDELLLMLDAAAEVVASFVGSYDLADVTETVAVRGGTVVLGGFPTGDVTLAYSDGTAVTGFAVNAAAGLLTGVPVWDTVLTASYSVGGEMPASVTLATLIIAAHLWETQRGNVGSGPLAADTDTGFGLPSGAGYAIPNRAKELLAAYVRPATVA